MSNKMKPFMNAWADEKLVDQAKQGDREAYSELVRRYRQRIYQTIYRFTQNHSDTDDLAQETFLQGFRALRHFRQKSGFYTWIFRIAVNRTLNFLKKKKKEMGREEYEENLLDREQSPISSPESVAVNREFEERLTEAVDFLPWPYRASFVLVTFQGMTHGEAARILDCSEKTVSWRMHKARKMLRARLQPYLKDKEVRDEL
jgi:RNA polymerase sigma-70 factor (ECF subfamily)